MTPWALLAVLLSSPVAAAGVPAGSRAVVVDPVGNQTSVQATGSSSNSIVDGPSLVDQTLDDTTTTTTDERVPLSGYRQVSSSQQAGLGGSTWNELTSSIQLSTNADEKNSDNVYAPSSQHGSSNSVSSTSTFSAPSSSSSVPFGVAQSIPSGQAESSQESSNIPFPVDRSGRPVSSDNFESTSQTDSFSPNIKQTTSSESTSDAWEDAETSSQVTSTESSSAPVDWFEEMPESTPQFGTSESEDKVFTPVDSSSSENTVQFMQSSSDENIAESVASSTIDSSSTMSSPLVGAVRPPLQTGQQSSGYKASNSVSQSTSDGEELSLSSESVQISNFKRPMDSSEEEVASPTVAQPLSTGSDVTVLTVFTTTPIQKHTKLASSTSEAQPPLVESEPLPSPDKKPSSFSLSSLFKGLSSSRQYELESRSDEGLYNQNSSSFGSSASENQQPPRQGGQSSDIISDMNSAFPGMFSQISSSAPVSFSSASRPTASVSQGVPPGELIVMLFYFTQC